MDTRRVARNLSTIDRAQPCLEVSGIGHYMMSICQSKTTHPPLSPPPPYSSKSSPLCAYDADKGWGTPLTSKISAVSSVFIQFGKSPTDNPFLASATALFVLTFVVTFYRCFTRFSRKIWGHDDSAALFSSLVFIFFVIGSCRVY
jgi:hypothetical protein